MTATLDATTDLQTSARRGQGSRWIDDWRPDDEAFWAGGGERIARRNLVFSVLSEHIGFSVWTMWSVLVLFLGPAYGFSPADKFLADRGPDAGRRACCACRTRSRWRSSAGATGPWSRRWRWSCRWC